MKLKYKKMIIMVSMCTMGIGLVTFSITGQPKKESTIVEIKQKVAAYDANESELSERRDLLATFVPSVTLIPTVTPEAVMATQEVTAILEKDSNQEINKLIQKYLNAKLSDDIDKFKAIVNDLELIDLDDIARKTKYIEKYMNLDCYTLEGPEEGSYIVYAYHEVKLTSIDTLAPAMNEFYVKTDEKGNLFVYLGKIDDDTEKYLNEARDTEQVMDLIYSVNEKLQKAVNGDEALASFYLKLKESAKDVTKNE